MSAVNSIRLVQNKLSMTAGRILCFAGGMIFYLAGSYCYLQADEPFEWHPRNNRFSNAEMYTLGVEILNNQFYHEDLRILREDFSPGGIIDEGSDKDVFKIRQRLTWMGNRAKPRFVPLKFEVDSALSISDQLVIVSGRANEQIINASVLQRTKILGIDNVGRYYFLLGFEENDIQSLVRNYMDSTVVEAVFIHLMKLYIKTSFWVTPITSKYLKEMPQLAEKYGDLKTSYEYDGETLVVELFGDYLRFAEPREPYSSTVIRYRIRYNYGENFSYTTDTLGTIRYPNSYD